MTGAGNQRSVPRWLDVLGAALLTLAAGASMASFLVVVLSLAVAILRHRLYDLDRIVSRVVTWALLTSLPASVVMWVPRSATAEGQP